MTLLGYAPPLTEPQYSQLHAPLITCMLLVSSWLNRRTPVKRLEASELMCRLSGKWSYDKGKWPAWKSDPANIYFVTPGGHSRDSAIADKCRHLPPFPTTEDYTSTWRVLTHWERLNLPAFRSSWAGAGEKHFCCWTLSVRTSCLLPLLSPAVSTLHKPQLRAASPGQGPHWGKNSTYP